MSFQQPALSAWTLARLRAELRAIERVRMEEGRPLSFGIAELDRLLGGGLPRAALHEVAPAAEGDAPAAAGFAAALLARAVSLGRTARVLWVHHELALFEDGRAYGPGLAAFGLDPGRVIFALAPSARTALDAMEQGLASGALAAVLGELRGANLALTATRRLSLAAQRGATPALLLRLGAGERLAAPVAAATRWRIAALASAAAPADGLGAPRFEAALVRNRRGPTARFSLEWRSHDRVFLPVPALRERLAPAALDRSDRTPAQDARRATA